MIITSVRKRSQLIVFYLIKRISDEVEELEEVLVNLFQKGNQSASRLVWVVSWGTLGGGAGVGGGVALDAQRRIKHEQNENKLLTGSCF